MIKKKLIKRIIKNPALLETKHIRAAREEFRQKIIIIIINAYNNEENNNNAFQHCFLG